ncbi:MAG TPA: four helix bundle protein [Anaerolineales bacterium]
MEQEQTKAAARSYRDLVVWQNAIKLAKEVYILVGHFPRQETYALGDQIRRAAVSVPSNIAEGQARKAPAEFRRFIHIALGSLAELDTQLVLAQEFGYLTVMDVKDVNLQIAELRKRLYALMNSLPPK